MLNNYCTASEYADLWISADNNIADKTDHKYSRFSGKFNIFDEKKHEVRSVYIKEVIFNKPATIVLWSDGTKTVTKCASEDSYSQEVGLVYCILKKIGNTSLDQLFTEWLPKQFELVNRLVHMTLKDVRKNSK